MKKIIIGILFSIMSVVASTQVEAFWNTTNLRERESNLDTLRDKRGNLHQLIEELQSFDVIRATCPGSGGIVVNSSITANDTIVAAIVLSSANTTIASSTTHKGISVDGTQTGRVIVRSKILGTMGNNISLEFKQIASTNTYFTKNNITSTPTAGSLMVFATGYAIDVYLSTCGANVSLAISTTLGTYASGADVCSAIQNDDAANSIVTCEAPFSTSSVVALSGILLSEGIGSNYFPNVIDGSFFTSGTGIITLNKNTPATSNDGLVLYIFRRPSAE